MERCRTEINKETIKALSKYHVANSGTVKKKKKWGYLGATLVLLYSILVAVGLFIGYVIRQGDVLTFFLKSIPYLFCTFIFFLTAARGKQHTLEKELKEYFEQMGTRYLEYDILQNGIRMIMNSKATMYEWNTIERMYSDDTYYYFTSGGKHSIIAKEAVSEEDKELMDEMMKSINKDNLEIVL